jgi:hypothetical protein
MEIPKHYRPSDTPHLSATRGMSEDAKAQTYDILRPGVPISEGQKAERVDRMRHRYENGSVNRRRRATVGSVVIPRIPWHENKDE